MKASMPMKVLALGALALSLAACGGREKASTGDAALVGTRWVLTKLDGTTVAPMEREPFLSLQASDHRASGFAGCNMFTGSYQLAGDKLSFSQMAMTRMACVPGMNVETAYSAALQDTRGYKLLGRTLSLTDASGKSLASFAAK